ncbi:MAG: hypothetical protein A2X56_12845, partial [Nitrospirae bacterium GWC2_57_13]
MMDFKSKRLAAAWLQTAVIVSLPFLRIKGESALRFDVPSLSLFFFGSVLPIGESFFFLLVLLLFFVGIMLFTVLFGRIWCGWMCPQTVFTELSGMLGNAAVKALRYPAAARAVEQAVLLLFSLFVSATLIWYFVSPYEMIRGVLAWSLGSWTLGSWAFFFALIYLDLVFVRQKFCAAVCPYARMQSAFFDHRTLTIAFDPLREEECRKCDACIHACPAGIDIRKGLQVECINCAECIDACTDRVSLIGKKSLIGYHFGIADATQKRARPRVIGLAALMALLMGLLVYTIAARVPMEFWVTNETMTNRATDVLSGQNRYSLFIENRSRASVQYQVGISGLEGAVLITPRKPVDVPAHGSLRLDARVISPLKKTAGDALSFRFVIEQVGRPEVRVTREAVFI